jgi:hypothetical protein
VGANGWSGWRASRQTRRDHGGVPGAGPNWWWLVTGAVYAVLAVAFAVAAVAIEEPDPLVLTAFFLVPATVGCLIGRCSVRWDDHELVIRNPVRTHRIPLVDVRSVDFPPRWARIRPMLVERSDHRIVRVTAVSSTTWWNSGRATRTADALRADVRRARTQARAGAGA